MKLADLERRRVGREGVGALAADALSLRDGRKPGPGPTSGENQVLPDFAKRDLLLNGEVFFQGT